MQKRKLKKRRYNSEKEWKGRQLESEMKTVGAREGKEFKAHTFT